MLSALVLRSSVRLPLALIVLAIGGAVACSTASGGGAEDDAVAGNAGASGAAGSEATAGKSGASSTEGGAAGAAGEGDAGSAGAGDAGSGGEGDAGAAGEGDAGAAGATAGEGGAAGGDAGSAGAGDAGAAGESGAAGAGGMCKLVAKYSSKDAFCNSCAETSCCAEVNGCLGDTRCNDDYVNCILACALLPDDNTPEAIMKCNADCGVQYPEGKQLYDTAIGCVDTKCAGICE